MNEELDLSYLEKTLGEDICNKIDNERKKCGEIKRERKFTTMNLTLLCLGTALYSGSGGLHDILRKVIADTGMNWNVSVAAFSKARLRFSPELFLPDLPASCRGNRKIMG